jgi:hypothetical protein
MFFIEFPIPSTTEVLPDLGKFMDSIHGRMMQCHKLSGPVEIDAGETPAGQEFLD